MMFARSNEKLLVEIVINQRASEELCVDDYLDEKNFCRLWKQVGRHFLVGRRWYRVGRQKIIDSNPLIDTRFDFVIL